MLAILALSQVEVAQHDIHVIVGTVLDGLTGIGDQLDRVSATTAQHLANGQPEIFEVIDHEIVELAERIDVRFGVGHERFCFSSLLTSALSAAGFTGL